MKCYIYNELADIPDEFIVIEKPMIIVAFTSWKKRINNVAKVVFNISNQTIKPDLIELNLTTEEFPNKENDLPIELNLLVENNVLNINWVDKNTYTFKKFIPTLQKHYGENYYLITIDDDKLYDNDYISFMINNIKNNDLFCAYNADIIGGLMIYKSTIFDKDFWELLTDEMIETKIDDTYINYYLKTKRKIFSKNIDNKKRWKTFNEIEPTRNYYLKDNRIVKAEKIALDIFNKV